MSAPLILTVDVGFYYSKIERKQKGLKVAAKVDFKQYKQFKSECKFQNRQRNLLWHVLSGM